MITREEVIEIAVKAGYIPTETVAGDTALYTRCRGVTTELERFAQAVYRRGIEDAANVCERMYTKPSNDKDLAGLRKRHKFIVEDCAYCVRKLGELE